MKSFAIRGKLAREDVNMRNNIAKNKTLENVEFSNRPTIDSECLYTIVLT